MTILNPSHCNTVALIEALNTFTDPGDDGEIFNVEDEKDTAACRELDMTAKIDWLWKVHGNLYGVGVRSQASSKDYGTITLRNSEVKAFEVARSYGTLAPRLFVHAYKDWSVVHVVDLVKMFSDVTPIGRQMTNRQDGKGFIAYPLTDIGGAYLGTWRAS